MNEPNPSLYNPKSKFVLCYGDEINHSYAGKSMVRLNEVYETDEEAGHCIFPKGLILDHRYRVVELIGRGTFCLVWMAIDLVTSEKVAIKVLKQTDCNDVDTEFILNKCLSDGMDAGFPLVKFHRLFYHNQHPCLVFELVEHNILTFLNYFDSSYVSLPISLVKKIVKDTLLGLDYMHKRGIIHTDLKPENVMANRPLFPYAGFRKNEKIFHPLEDDPNLVDFKLGDIGNSCFIDTPLNDLIQTRQYRAPEVLIGLPYDTSTDIWSLACMTFELLTRRHLFDPVLPDDEEEEENDSNKFEFDSIHISLIESLLGPLPEDWVLEGEYYNELYDENGNLRVAMEPDNISLFDLIVSYGLTKEDAEEIVEFLEPMLAIIPSQRPSAEELLNSPWLYKI